MKGISLSFGVGGLLLLLAILSYVLSGRPPPPAAAPMGERGLEPVDLTVRASPGGFWEEPLVQSAGGDWIFDVFTPPIIFFNPHTSEFTLTPPLARPVEPPFGIELVRVDRPLYRLQYAAHVGEEGRFLIEVHDLENERWVRARQGQALEDADARIVRFSVERVRVSSDDPGQTAFVEDRVRLVIFDERLGEEVTLTREPRYDEGFLVEVRDVSGTIHAFPRSGPLVLPTGEFHLVDLVPEPPSIRVERRTPDSPPLTRFLTPAP
jgi:hypothetical protein